MILTNSEIMDINQNAEFDSAISFARKIESAVLEKLKAQEPVGETVPSIVWEGLVSIAWEADKQPPPGTKLYEHPLPPDDVVRKYEELLYAVNRKFPDETRHQTALRYIKTAEAPSYTNTAMEKVK